MNLKPKDKQFESNLRLLSSCAKIEEISIKAKASKRTEYLRYLDSEEGTKFYNFLIRTINKLNSVEPININSTEDLLRFLPNEDMIPEKYLEEYARHKEAFSYEKNYPYKDLQLADFRDLQTIIKDIQDNSKNSNYDSSELSEYMSSHNHTKAFKNFSKTMLTSNPAIINIKYSNLAKSIAKENDLYTDTFAKRLSTLLQKPKLTLAMDSLGRTWNATKKLIPALALSSSLLLGFHEYKEHVAENNTQTETTLETDNSISPNIEFQYTGPISETPALDSYEDACKDFLNKTAEVYKYNTGKDIDLSNYGQKNIESANSKIYIAEYNGKTYRFSTLSNYSSNQVYLKTALEAAGATITEDSAGITYIFDDDNKSIAIVDGQGNPIRSGNILEEATSGYKEMYNQTYIHEAKNMLLEQGIEPINMSEAELIGKYILSSNYDIQNDELSIALGETSKALIYNIEETFWIKNGKEDSYAIYLYEQKSKQFEQSFNKKVHNELENSTSDKNISDNFEDR